MGEEAPDRAAEALAASVLEMLCDRDLRIVTSESCTGGLIASLLTDVEGRSHAFERGFVVYSEEAKIELLDVDPALIEGAGVVSAVVAAAMAEGALGRSRAEVSVAVTGYAGPRQGEEEVGLVHVAVATQGGTRLGELHLGERDRATIRALTACHALQMVLDMVKPTANRSSQSAERVPGSARFSAVPSGDDSRRDSMPNQQDRNQGGKQQQQDRQQQQQQNKQDRQQGGTDRDSQNRQQGGSGNANRQR